MSRPIRLVPVILAIVVPALACALGPNRAEAAVDDCLSKPNATAPEGRHWYYRLDRSSKRRCWFLGVVGEGGRAASSPKRVKLRRSESPKPVPAVKPVTPALPKIATAEVTVETRAESAIAPPATDAKVADAAFSRRWSEVAASASSPTLSAQVEAELAQARDRTASSPSRQHADAGAKRDDRVSNERAQRLRTSYAPEPSVMHSEDDMPLIWPVLSPAERQLTGEPQTSAPTVVLAFVAGGLGVLAVFAFAIFKLSAAPPARRLRSFKRWTASTASICRRQQIPPTCAQVFAARSHAERASELVAAMRRAGRAGPMLAPSQSTQDPEDASLARWLERRRVAA
jgi:hypothetical protein